MTFLTICYIILSFITSRVLVSQIRSWALQTHYLDIPNFRSSHTIPTPKGGGLAIASVTLIFLGILFFAAPNNRYLSEANFTYFIVAMVVACIGWLDDQRSLPPKLRLLSQVSLVLVFVTVTGSIKEADLPGLPLTFAPILAFTISLIWIIGLTNAYNFMDGIDGLAGTQAVIAGTGWIFLLLLESQVELAVLVGLVVATSYGFLLLNLYPALIFMGDVGSTFLGFTFGAIPLLAYAETGNARLFPCGAILLLPFIFDSGFTILRRAINGENVLIAHRTHLYQRLVVKGFSHATVTKVYALLEFTSVTCGITYYLGTPRVMLATLVILVAQCSLLVVGVTAFERYNGVNWMLKWRQQSTK